MYIPFLSLLLKFLKTTATALWRNFLKSMLPINLKANDFFLEGTISHMEGKIYVLRITSMKTFVLQSKLQIFSHKNAQSRTICVKRNGIGQVAVNRIYYYVDWVHSKVKATKSWIKTKSPSLTSSLSISIELNI